MISNHRPRTLDRRWILPLAAFFLSGCGHPIQETAAHKIADALPSVLGPAAHYSVQVDGDPFALTRGRAQAVHIQGEEVQASRALTLDALDVDAHDVSFSRQTRHLTHIGQTKFVATLGQEHLAASLAHTKSRPPGLTVTLRAEDLQARVPVTFLGLQTTAVLTGNLAPNADEPSKLDFVTDRAKLGIVPLPAALVNLALERLNPVVDVSGLRVPLTVTEVSVVHSRLRLAGNADLQGLVQTD